MSKVIYKYYVAMGHSEIHLSPDARFLLFALQGGDCNMWVETNPSAQQVPHRFYVACTGEPVPSDYPYHLGSLVTPDGYYVWHLYVDRIPGVLA